MQLVAQRIPLLEACKVAEKAILPRPVNTVLSNLLVRAHDGVCSLTGANPNVGVRLPFLARIEQEGEALVPASQLLGILRQATENELILQSKPGRVQMRSRRAAFELRSDDSARFPLFPSCPKGLWDELATEPLRLAIQRTLFAVGKEASGHSFRGMLWERENDRVRLVATDNRRLAVAESPARMWSEQTSPREALVPLEAMELLEQLATMPGSAVQAIFRSRAVFFRSDGATLCASLLNGPFPPWRKALSLEPRYRLLLPVGPFLSGVKQAAVLHDKTAKLLLLQFQGGHVTLRSRLPGTGHARVEQALTLPCSREPVEVAFNPTYLAEMLKVLDAETTVQLELRDPDAAALFSAGTSYKHVLMPLRRG